MKIRSYGIRFFSGVALSEELTLKGLCFYSDSYIKPIIVKFNNTSDYESVININSIDKGVLLLTSSFAEDTVLNVNIPKFNKDGSFTVFSNNKECTYYGEPNDFITFSIENEVILLEDITTNDLSSNTEESPTKKGTKKSFWNSW